MDPLAPLPQSSGYPVASQDPTALGPAATAIPPAADPAPGGTGPSGPGMDHPLRPLVGLWIEKIRLAAMLKLDRFGETASECMQFFDGPYDFLYDKKNATRGVGFTVTGGDEEEADMPSPAFQMTVNKVAEAVQIFGPVLYHRNPVRQVNPRVVPEIPPEFFGDPTLDPNAGNVQAQAQGQQQGMARQDALRASLLQFYLNWSPTELKLKDHSRRAIDEAIIKGMGCLFTEAYEPKGTPTRPDGTRMKMVGSFYETVDNLLIDPDAESLQDARWIARRCIHPSWMVEREYGLPPDSLRGVAESYNKAAEINSASDPLYRRQQGSNDLVVYYRIFSKMGVGGRLSGCSPDLRGVLEQFGDFCHLVVCEHIPYPLNLTPELIGSADPGAPEQILSRLDWPIPFWADDDWPVTPIVFHEVPRSAWPMSHFKPAMGELKFLNWAYSFMAGRIRNTCRDFLAVAKSVGEEMKEAILHGRDLTLLEIEKSHGTISDVVQFLQHPPMNGDVWKVIQAVTENFEKRTGLTELVYGESGSSYRSAEEANLKGNQLQIRPDDMAQRVEDAMTVIARKEAIAARWLLTGADVQVPMGAVAASFWDKVVKTQDLFEMTKQLEYRIEAGSARKPNKQRDADNMKQALTNLYPNLFGYAQATGNVGPVNALITDWAKSIDLSAGEYLLAPPPPAPPPTGGPAGPRGQGGADGGAPPAPPRSQQPPPAAA